MYTPIFSKDTSLNKVWSPDLFDTDTGDYPKSPLPNSVSYPIDTDGTFWYFSHSQTGGSSGSGRVWPTGDSGGGANAWDEQDHTPPDFSTYYAVDMAWSSPPSNTETDTKIFTFSGGEFSSYENPKIKIVYEYSGALSTVVVPPLFIAIAYSGFGFYISRDGGLTWGVLNNVSGHNDSISPSWNIAKTTFSLDLSEIVDLSLLQIKVILHGNTAAGGGNSALLQAHLKVYAVYLDDI
jgi:hypothetical protein